MAKNSAQGAMMENDKILEFIKRLADGEITNLEDAQFLAHKALENEE